MDEIQSSYPQRLNLHELIVQETALLAEILENEGEILPEIEIALKTSQKDLQYKIDAYHQVMERLALEVEYRSKKAEHQKFIQKKCEAILEKMRESIKDVMLHHDKKRLTGKDIGFMLTRTKPSISLKEGKTLEDIPDLLKRQKIQVYLDKEVILKLYQTDPETFLSLYEKVLSIEPSYALKKFENLKSRKDLSDERESTLGRDLPSHEVSES
jgi:hypothetical protein